MVPRPRIDSFYFFGQAASSTSVLETKNGRVGAGIIKVMEQADWILSLTTYPTLYHSQNYQAGVNAIPS
jgi:hypothetical protein